MGQANGARPKYRAPTPTRRRDGQWRRCGNGPDVENGDDRHEAPGRRRDTFNLNSAVPRPAPNEATLRHREEPSPDRRNCAVPGAGSGDEAIQLFPRGFWIARAPGETGAVLPADEDQVRRGLALACVRAPAAILMTQAAGRERDAGGAILLNRGTRLKPHCHAGFMRPESAPQARSQARRRPQGPSQALLRHA
jgi:hypothetical protein